jgi:predicted transposase/invertase (TIGR01784 family)
MQTNKKFKNSVFVSLFNDPDLLRELYCALGGVNLPSDAAVSINTLENVLYMDFNNDISFEIGGKLVVLIEHQSTINPNMALRLLIYITRVLEKRVKSRTLYSKKPVSIPYPEFYVLYNGTEPFPDYDIVRLSDLFEKPQELGLSEKHRPLLELEVKVININEGRNEAIANRCKKLSEYSAFIARKHTFWKETDSIEEEIKNAITYCRKHDILTEYLEVHGSEVLNMILTEWNMEDAIAFAREEGRENGREEEREQIIQNVRNALAEGIPLEIIQKITGLSLDEISKL